MVKENQGPKYDEGKLDWSVFPFYEAEEVCRVFVAGTKKYGAPFTYRNGINWKRLFSATIRHLEDVQTYGLECIDEETGCYAVACAGANILMMISQIYLQDLNNRTSIEER